MKSGNQGTGSSYKAKLAEKGIGIHFKHKGQTGEDAGHILFQR